MDIISYQIGKNSAPQPSGSLSITENGTYDVTEKASAVVNVQGGGAGLPINIASSCPSPFLLQQSNLSGSVKYIFPTTKCKVVNSNGETPYLRSSGTQYIDTGVNCSSNVKIRAKLNWAEIANYVIIGNYIDDDETLRLFNFGNLFYLDFGNGESGRIYGGGFALNTDYEIEIGNRYVKDLVTGNNIISGSDRSFSYSSKICLFGISGHCSSGTFEYVQILVDDVIVRNFVPATSQETGHENELCFYDTVTNAYFYNQGTGSFDGVGNVSVGEVVTASLSPNPHAYATFSYQWQKLVDDTFVNISGATQSTYTTQTGDNAVRCVVTATGTSEGAFSSSAMYVMEV